MIEILIIIGVVIGVCIFACVFLHTKGIYSSNRKKSRKYDRPGEKRVSNVPANLDSKIEGIGESIINSSGRRKKR
jgi:NADH:ubiquinone oxidoreductase subunit 3 (subunit A)